MKKIATMIALIGMLPPAQAGEAWQPVFEDAMIRVAIDSANLNRGKQTVMFREREIQLQTQTDPASMRRIQEIQYRRLANCASRALSVLSRTVFSDRGSLLYYEANRPSTATWNSPQSEREIKLLEAVCGPA